MVRRRSSCKPSNWKPSASWSAIRCSSGPTGSESLAPGFTRHVLSDWDCDRAARAQVLRLTRDGFTRVAVKT